VARPAEYLSRINPPEFQRGVGTGSQLKYGEAEGLNRLSQVPQTGGPSGAAVAVQGAPSAQGEPGGPSPQAEEPFRPTDEFERILAAPPTRPGASPLQGATGVGRTPPPPDLLAAVPALAVAAKVPGPNQQIIKGILALIGESLP
jgi:hypothetical protein